MAHHPSGDISTTYREGGSLRRAVHRTKVVKDLETREAAPAGHDSIERRAWEQREDFQVRPPLNPALLMFH